MRIPFFSRKEEHRNAAPYTDAIIAQILSAATGTTEASGLTTAALEIAAGVFARAFACAVVEGADIPPGQLSNLARAVVSHGEAVAWYDGRGLIETVNFDVLGQAHRDTWRYRMQIDSPGGHLLDVKTGSDRVVHWQYSYDMNRPWIGVGPLQRAIESGKLTANIEKKLREETQGTVGYLLPIPTDSSDETVTELKADLKSLEGRTSVVETTTGGWGEGRMSAPRQDYVPQRIGPNPPVGMVQIHSAMQNAILACCGVPIELVSPSDGSGQREAWRRFLHGTVQPLANVLKYELSRVYAREVTIKFDALFASDIAGRARAFQSMVHGGVMPEKAAALSGLLSDD